EQPRRTHAAPDAHGDHGVAGLAALALDEGVADQTRAAHAVGVADGDGAAVDVVLLGVDAEPVAAVEALHGKGLVELPEVDVGDLEAVALQQLWHREDRADSHLVGLAARHHHTAVDAERIEAALLRELRIHHHAGGRAIRELARIPRRHVSALAHG